MRKTYGFIILLCVAMFATSFAANLEEGSVVEEMDARLEQDNNQNWRAVFTENETLPDLTSLPLLANAELDRMLFDAQDRAEPFYRLSGTVTQFQKQNYLYVTYFVPLSKPVHDVEEPEPKKKKTDDPNKVESIPFNDPNDYLAVPDEVIQKLRKGKKPAPLKVRAPEKKDTKEMKFVPDSILTNKTGFVEKKNDEYFFVPSGLGYGVQKERYKLLPSKALEHSLQKQKTSLDPIRFRIFGKITHFAGQRYVLIHRSVPTYSHQNFPR